MYILITLVIFVNKECSISLIVCIYLSSDSVDSESTLLVNCKFLVHWFDEHIGEKLIFDPVSTLSKLIYHHLSM